MWDIPSLMTLLPEEDPMGMLQLLGGPLATVALVTVLAAPPAPAPALAPTDPAFMDPVPTDPASTTAGTAVPPTADPGVSADTRTFYATHCAACHGETGRGDGPVAPLLDPAPRDFGSGEFHIVSTTNRRPSHQDLVDSLRLGVPGTSMPGWAHLAEERVDELARLVHELMVESAAAQQTAGPVDDALRARVAAELAPGEPPRLGAPPELTPALAARGAELYGTHCVECHDIDGRGLAGRDLRDADGRPSPSRDFTRGLLRGGTDPLQIALRTHLGMPGTAMPAHELPREDLWAVAHHVSGLVPPGAQAERQPVRREVVALRLDGPLDPPADEPRLAEALEAAPWDRAPTHTLPLLPRAWDDPVPESLRVQALHDGERLLLRVSWSRDGLAQAPPALRVELSDEEEPPLFAPRVPAGSRASWSWPPSGPEAHGRAATRFTTERGRWLLLAHPADEGLPLPAQGNLRLRLHLRSGRALADTVWHELVLGR